MVGAITTFGAKGVGYYSGEYKLSKSYGVIRKPFKNVLPSTRYEKGPRDVSKEMGITEWRIRSKSGTIDVLTKC